MSKTKSVNDIRFWIITNSNFFISIWGNNIIIVWRKFLWNTKCQLFKSKGKKKRKGKKEIEWNLTKSVMRDKCPSNNFEGSSPFKENLIWHKEIFFFLFYFLFF